MAVIPLAGQSLREVVDGSAKPVVVFFHKPNCSPCAAVTVQVKQVAKRYGQDVAVYSIDTATDGAGAEGYWSTGTPLVVLFSDGLEVWRWRGGSVTADKIAVQVDELLPAQHG